MRKSVMLVMRVDTEIKERIEAAARARGKTMSAFVLEAAMSAAKRSHEIDPRAVSVGGVPAFFSALCETAKAGGESGYVLAGEALARHLPDLVPDDLSRKQWGAKIAEVQRAASRGDEEFVLAWFDELFPECMALVPARRRDRFVLGAVRQLKERRA